MKASMQIKGELVTTHYPRDTGWKCCIKLQDTGSDQELDLYVSTPAELRAAAEEFVLAARAMEKVLEETAASIDAADIEEARRMV